MLSFNSRKAQQWAQRWRQLGVMLSAGLTTEKSLQTLFESEKHPPESLQRMIGLVQRGMSLSAAGKRAACLTSFNTSLLESAESAGQLPSALEFIARRRLTQLQRINTLASALWLPQCVLFIGALVAVFIRVITYDAGFKGVIDILLVVLLIRLLTILGLALLRLDTRIWLSLLWPIRWLRQHSKLYQMSVEQVFYSSFIWQINAGVDAAHALERCRNCLSAISFKRAVQQASEAMAAGNGVSASLQVELVLTKRLAMVLAIAEESGRWQQAVEHELKLQRQKIDQILDAKFEWVPRLYYVFIIVIIVSF